MKKKIQDTLNIIKKMKFMLCLGAFKNPFGLNLRLNAILPILGYIHILKRQSLSRVTIYCFFVLLLGAPSLFLNFSWVSVSRILQLIGILFLFDYLLRIFERRDFLYLTRSIALFSTLYLIIELIFFPPFVYKNFYDIITLPRYHGIVGEVNYTAALHIGSFYVSFLLKDKITSLVLALLTILSLSVNAFFFLFLFLICFYLSKKIKMFGEIAWRVTLGYIAFYPLLLPMINDVMNRFFPSFFSMMELVTSQRHGLHLLYLKIFSDNPLGIGYFRQFEMISQEPYKSMASQVNEEHSLFLQVLIQLGPLSFMALVYGFYILFRKYCISPESKVTLSCLLLFFMGLNGTHELSLYLVIAFVVNKKLVNDGTVYFKRLKSSWCSVRLVCHRGKYEKSNHNRNNRPRRSISSRAPSKKRI